MSSVKIGNFIQQCRKEKGLTQEELGEILGVSGKSISRWENNITMPDLSLITTIAKELGVEVSELLNGEKMNKQELLELKSTVNKIIKYSNYEEKIKIKKANILLIIQIIILLLAIINNLIVICNTSIQQILNISLHVIVLGMNFVRYYDNKNEHEFKVNNMILSDTNKK